MDLALRWWGVNSLPLESSGLRGILDGNALHGDACPVDHSREKVQDKVRGDKGKEVGFDAIVKRLMEPDRSM